ncbi:zinc-dependent alcohol dehydrogenase [Sorangium sp. So ce1036]|uniref:zinc-dependent alcohol dehydrogenase n=1 Tax=Sorangium sp. So ce1036 TaxID=3133328 RepID=UPI003F0A3BDC
MLALTYHGPRCVRVEKAPEPRIQHPNDVILRVTRAAICGSDLHLYHGYVPDTRVGTIFGHEFTGVVEEVGPCVQTLQRGDRVVVPFNIACGTCFFCQRERTSACENTNPLSTLMSGIFGYSHTTGGYQGGQAERVRVPFADVGPMKIPDDLSEEDVLFLSDILPTGYQAAEMGDITPADTVAVFGCGPVGLIAQRCAWLLGARRVIAVDSIDYRLAFARCYARAETVDFSKVPDVVTVLRDMTDGRGPDVCIEAVGLEASGSLARDLLGKRLRLEAGSPVALNWAIQSVRRGGRVSIVGVYGPPWNLIDVGAAMNKGLTLKAGQCDVKRYMPHLLQHIRKGNLDPRALITHRVPLESAPEMYRLFAARTDGIIKAVLIPDEAG